MNIFRHACLAGVLMAAHVQAEESLPSGLVKSYLPANVSVPVTLCDQDAANISAPHYFHFAFTMHSGAGSSFAPMAPGGLNNTPDLPAGTECQTNASVFTSNVPANLTDSVVLISSCYVYPPPGGRTCNNTIHFYTFRTPVTPTIVVNPSSTLNLAFGSNPVSRNETITLNPNFASIPIAGACTVQNGATASIATSPIRTDDNGQAVFSMTAGIDTPTPGLVPSATCTFTEQSPATGGASASVPISAPVYNPTIAVVSPPLPINHPGSTPIKVQVSPAYRNVSVHSACSATNGASLAPATADQLTSPAPSLGQTTFTITASNLAIVNPNTTVVPTASCVFSIPGTSPLHTATASFNTGNACSSAFGLQPAPPGCGNP